MRSKIVRKVGCEEFLLIERGYGKDFEYIAWGSGNFLKPGIPGTWGPNELFFRAEAASVEYR